MLNIHGKAIFLIFRPYILSLMKKYSIFALIIGFSLLSLASAQKAATIAFVNPTLLIKAYGPDTKAAQLMIERDKELKDITDEIAKLQEKSTTAGGLTADERARANLLVTTLDQVRKRYDADIQEASAPILASINESINQVAKQLGYTLVLDAEVASASGLIVYADFSAIPDITEQVVAVIKANNGN